MSSDETLTFPTGVETGRPFSDPDTACAWLTQAMAGEWGPAGYKWARTHAYGRVGQVRSTAPNPTEAYPADIVAVTTPDAALDYAVRLAEVDPRADQSDLGECAARRIDVDGLARYAAGLFIPSPVLTDLFLNQANTLRGWTIACRAALPAAKNRGKHAYYLGRLEAATDDAYALFVTCANQWVTTNYVDAVKLGAVDVEVAQTPNAGRRGIDPVGVIRLGY